MDKIKIGVIGTGRIGQMHGHHPLFFILF